MELPENTPYQQLSFLKGGLNKNTDEHSSKDGNRVKSNDWPLGRMRDFERRFFPEHDKKANHLH